MSERCEYFEEQLSAYMDGALSDSETTELREHLASCERCRALRDVFTGLSDELGELGELAEPPAALADGVMDRIYAWEEAHPPAETAAPIDIHAARTAKKPARRWTGLAVAACLVVVIGGAYAGTSLFHSRTAAKSAGNITLEAAVTAPALVPAPEAAPALDGAVDFAAAEEADMGYVMEEAAEAEEAEEEIVLAEDDAAPLTAAAAEETVTTEDDASWTEADAAEDDAMADTALYSGQSAARADMTLAAAAEPERRPVYTWESPAHVPAGREAAFQALIRAAAPPEDLDTDRLDLVAAVEYNGVIYEFLTDDDGHLLWRDAAESVDPIPSPGTEADLWDIFG